MTQALELAILGFSGFLAGLSLGVVLAPIDDGELSYIWLGSLIILLILTITFLLVI